MSIEVLIADPSVGIEDITEQLDGMTPDARWGAVGNLSRDLQRALYDKAAASPPANVLDFIGKAAPLEPVLHRGCNTLPVPNRLRHFVKPFARLPEEARRVFGYNETALRRLIGPGYFVAYETAGNPGWEARGDVVVDYLQTPSAQPPAGWPAIVSNSRGLQRYIYGGTRDFIRRVSSHVTIGAVFKVDEPLDHYFVLCRAP